MRKRGVPAWAALASLSAMATFALAQPHSHSSRSVGSKADDRVSASSSASPAPGAAAPAVAAAAAPVPADESSDGGKLSPLNPAPTEFADAGPPDRVDYDRLLADVASLRSRVAAVGDTLFHSRVAIVVETRSDHGRVANLAVSLDDGVVWTSPSTFRAEDATKIYDHAVAPGHHAVTVDVERRDERDDAFRSTQRSRFIVDVPNDQRVTVELRLSDDSNLGAEFRADKKGEYDLRVVAKVTSQAVGR